jgi:hypothetical protein
LRQYTAREVFSQPELQNKASRLFSSRLSGVLRKYPARVVWSGFCYEPCDSPIKGIEIIQNLISIAMDVQSFRNIEPLREIKERLFF